MKKLTVAVPPGIGDSLWSMVKIQSIMQIGGYDYCKVAIKDTKLNRGKDFLLHFDFVDEVEYEVFPIHPPSAEFGAIFSTGLSKLFGESAVIDSGFKSELNYVEETGEYIYIDSCQNFLNRYDWLLIANGHLERGNRLETWLLQFKTNFDIGVDNFVFTENEIENAERIHKYLLDNKPFVVFYLGPKWGNTINGHNRGSLWTLKNWYETVMLMNEHNKDLRFVLIGASYDADYAGEFYTTYGDKRFINLTGATEIGTTYALIKRSNFILSYQSGIGIFSVYLGVPTACFWRPYGNSLHPDFFISVREEMANAWAPPWALGIDGTYLPQVYTKCSPQSIVEEVISRKWIE